jgi:hypothetical protein
MLVKTSVEYHSGTITVTFIQLLTQRLRNSEQFGTEIKPLKNSVYGFSYDSHNKERLFFFSNHY